MFEIYAILFFPQKFAFWNLGMSGICYDLEIVVMTVLCMYLNLNPQMV